MLKNSLIEMSERATIEMAKVCEVATGSDYTGTLSCHGTD